MISLRNALTTVTLISLAASPIHAEQLYDLSERDPVVGQATESSTNLSGSDGTIVMTMHGQVLGEGTISFESSSTSTERIIEIQDGKITKYTSTYTAYQSHTTSDFLGEKTNETESSPLLNAEVTWELVDDQYVPHLENASAKQLEELDPEPYGDAAIYPEDPIAVGHAWALSREAIAEMVEQDLDGDYEGEGKLTLLRIGTYKGQRCAVLACELELDAPMHESEIPDDFETGRFHIKVTGTIYRSLADRVDIGAELEGELVYSYEGSIDDNAFSVTTRMAIELSGSDRLID